MDDDDSKKLSIPDFGKACKDFKIEVSNEYIPILFNIFDIIGNGTI
jgi:hypothetical protein